MDAWTGKEMKCDGHDAIRPGNKDIYVQLVISLILGLSAFVFFCVNIALLFWRLLSGCLIRWLCTVPTTTMAHPLRCPKAAQRS